MRGAVHHEPQRDSVSSLFARFFFFGHAEFRAIHVYSIYFFIYITYKKKKDRAMRLYIFQTVSISFMVYKFPYRKIRRAGKENIFRLCFFLQIRLSGSFFFSFAAIRLFFRFVSFFPFVLIISL